MFVRHEPGLYHSTHQNRSLNFQTDTQLSTTNISKNTKSQNNHLSSLLLFFLAFLGERDLAVFFLPRGDRPGDFASRPGLSDPDAVGLVGGGFRFRLAASLAASLGVGDADLASSSSEPDSSSRTDLRLATSSDHAQL